MRWVGRSLLRDAVGVADALIQLWCLSLGVREACQVLGGDVALVARFLMLPYSCILDRFFFCTKERWLWMTWAHSLYYSPTLGGLWWVSRRIIIHSTLWQWKWSHSLLTQERGLKDREWFISFKIQHKRCRVREKARHAPHNICASVMLAKPMTSVTGGWGRQMAAYRMHRLQESSSTTWAALDRLDTTHNMRSLKSLLLCTRLEKTSGLSLLFLSFLLLSSLHPPHTHTRLPHYIHAHLM